MVSGWREVEMYERKRAGVKGDMCSRVLVDEVEGDSDDMANFLSRG